MGVCKALTCLAKLLGRGCWPEGVVLASGLQVGFAPMGAAELPGSPSTSGGMDNATGLAGLPWSGAKACCNAGIAARQLSIRKITGEHMNAAVIVCL